MTPLLTVLPAAGRDLDEQAEFLAQAAGLERGLRFLDSAAATFAMIAQMPELGWDRQSTHHRLSVLRVWRVKGSKKHVIIYRMVGGGVEIVRVLRGARDLGRELEPEVESVPL